jgi:hypothetical protein
MLHPKNVAIGKLYAWKGYKETLYSLPRRKLFGLNQIDAKALEGTTELSINDLFVPLEIIHINNRQFDVKLLSKKGEIRYLFCWYIDGFPAKLIWQRLET